MVAIRVCECCGHPIPPEGVRSVLKGYQLQFYDIVERAGTVGIGGKELKERLYAGTHAGGPVSSSIIAVMAKHLQKKLKPFGLPLYASRGKGSTYQLRVLEQK